MIVTNFSTDKYRIGQERLRDSLYWNKQMKMALYGTYKEIGSPTHQQSPYEFKIHSMKLAAKEDPIVLWADASIWLNGDIKPVIELIERDGYFMEQSGNMVRDWTNAHTMDYFLMSNETDFEMPIAGCFGIDFNSQIGKEFMHQWELSAKNGCFKGQWDGDDRHRHDMSCMGIISNMLDMKFQKGGTHIFYTGPGYAKAPEDGTFFCQGLV